MMSVNANGLPSTVLWYNQVNAESNSGSSSVEVKPGFTVQTPPTGWGPNGKYSVTIHDIYAAEYEQPDWGWGWIFPDYSSETAWAVDTTLAYNWLPDVPSTPTGGPGQNQGITNTWYSFTTSAYDADGNNVGYWFVWGYEQASTWSGYVSSGNTGTASYAWPAGGQYEVQAYAVEALTGLESSLSNDDPVTIEPTLTIQVGPNGGGASPNPTSPNPGTYSYSFATQATVQAYLAINYYFDHWLLDGTTDVYYNPYTLTMSSDHTLTAYFTLDPQLTVSVSPSNGGSTSSSPSSSSGYYNPGQQVTVTATPAAGGWHFEDWMLNNQAAGSSNPITVTMNGNQNLEAVFVFPGGPGCPYVYDWNGTGFVKDNNILPESEIGNGTYAKDYFLLEQPLVPVFRTRQASTYELQIGEFESEIDYIDQMKLIAVDHSQGTNVAVTPEGQIITYTNPAPPISAIDNNGVSERSEISTMNGNVSDSSTYFQGNAGDWLLLDFGNVTGPYANLILRDDMMCDKVCIDVQILNATGDWQTVETLNPRSYWSIEAANMTAYLPKTGDFKVRLYWTTPHRLDFAGLDTSPPAPTQISTRTPTLAINSTMGNVTQKLLYEDGQYVELVNGQYVTIWFVLPSQQQNTTRSFILNTDGYYYTITP